MKSTGPASSGQTGIFWDRMGSLPRPMTLHSNMPDSSLMATTLSSGAVPGWSGR
jgi:hypothetical protein